jgi:hypothetical protein
LEGHITLLVVLEPVVIDFIKLDSIAEPEHLFSAVDSPVEAKVNEWSYLSSSAHFLTKGKSSTEKYLLCKKSGFW